MKTAKAFLFVVAIGVTGVAVTALMGHLKHAPALYRWYGEDIGMALATALCFLFVGVGLFVVAVLLSR